VAPECAPTRAALLTGRHPLRTGTVRVNSGTATTRFYHRCLNVCCFICYLLIIIFELLIIIIYYLFFIYLVALAHHLGTFLGKIAAGLLLHRSTSAKMPRSK
jgi:hypothetical protein